MKKATHQGHCQLCGNLQKLPSGVLSNHGYMVRWQMFTGTCRGSGELPYEQSCDLIKRQIPRIEERLSTLNQERLKRLQPATEPIAMIQVWKKSTSYRRGYYDWVEAEIVSRLEKYHHNGESYTIFIGLYKDGENSLEEKLDTRPTTVLDLATKLNANYVSQCIDRRIIQTDEYLQWCQKRVEDWQPKELSLIQG